MAEQTAPVTVAAVLDALAAWAEDESQFWQGPTWCNRDDPRQTCVYGQVNFLRTGNPRRSHGHPRDDAVYDDVEAALESAAREMGYGYVSVLNDQGGLPAVRQMIARARAEVGT